MDVPSFVILENIVGNVPVIGLRPISKYKSFFKCPISDGTVPVNQLPPKQASWRSNKFSNSMGIVPVNSLVHMFN